MTDLPVVCRLTSPELRERRAAVLTLLRAHMRERVPLAAGYRLRFDAAGGVLAALAALIEAERECCPFLRFQLTIEPAQGPVWLEISGPEGTREFLDTDLGLAEA
jgi:hypothetical protein